MKRSIFLAGILLPVLCSSQKVYSQTPPAQKTDTARSPRLLTTSPLLGGITVTEIVTPVNAKGNSFTMQTPVVDFGIPLYKNFGGAHSVLVKTGVRYQGLFLSGEKNIGSSNFQSLTLPLLVSYGLTLSTNISFIGLATVASDFRQTIESNDILYSAGIRLGFRQRSAFRFGITMIYINDNSGRYLLPLPDIDWTISKRLTFSAVLPARVSLKYKLDQVQSIGITGSFNNGQYALHDQPEKQYLQLQQFSAGLMYEARLGRRWNFNLVAGHSLMQRLETFDRDQKVSLNDFKELYDRPANVSYRQNSFVFQGGISWQF